MVLKHLGAAWSVFRGLQTRMDEANLTLVAAGGAFFTMLSVFPGLAAVITLLGFIADPASVEEQLGLLQQFMPGDAFAIVESQVQRMVLTNTSTLGWATIVSTLAALWSARKGTDALVRGVNAVYHGPPRKGWHAMALSFLLTVLFSLIAVVALLALVIVPVISTIVNLPFVVEVVPPVVLDWVNGALLQAARWTIALGVIFTGVWLLYRLAPNVPREIKGFFNPGAILSIAVWGAGTYGFAFYLSNFGNYSKVYGSIGAVVALLMFLYISIFVVLLGAALNAELDPLVDAEDPGADVESSTADAATLTAAAAVAPDLT